MAEPPRDSNNNPSPFVDPNGKASAANVDASGNLVASSTTRKGNKFTTTPTIATTSTLFLAANSSRIAAILTNPKTGGQTLFLGVSGVTASTYALSLEPGDTYIDNDSVDAWYAVVSSGSLTASVTEVR